MSAASNPVVWVVTTAIGETDHLVAAARRVMPDVVAVAIGPRALADDAATLGVSEVRWLGEPPSPAGAEAFAASLGKLVEQAAPCAVVLASTEVTRLLAGQLAATLDTSAVTGVDQLTSEDATIVAAHRFWGGAAVRTEELAGPTALLTISTSAFPAPERVPGPLVQVTEVPAVVDPPPWRLLDRRPEPRSTSGLAAARIVVGAGRGVTTRESLARLGALVDAFGGELACTRPLAEGLDWMPRDRYLGVSGQEIAPDLYLALGVSGQSQHMVGVDRARVIVAVNKDPAAPIFAQADYGIVGDLEAVVPALLRALGDRR